MFNSGKDTTKPIDKLHQRSAKIVDIFTTTITDLSQVNNEIDEHITSREEELKQIQLEHARLHAIKADNLKVIGKIESIFA